MSMGEHLPPPLKDLLLKDLQLRLHEKIEPCYHMMAFLLVTEFYRIAAQWQKRLPNMPMAAYQGFFGILLIPGMNTARFINEVRARPSRFLMAFDDHELGVLVGVLILEWAAAERRVGVNKVHISALVVELLSEIFEEAR